METWLNLWTYLLRSEGLIMIFVLVGIAVVTAIELWVPAESGQSIRGRMRNLIFLVLFKVAGLAGIALWYSFVPLILMPIDAENGFVRVLLVLANLLLIDLLFYAYHRAQHRFSFLWAIHELHHADSELNATTSYRTYWLEFPVQGILIATPTLFLFGGLGPVHGMVVMVCSIFFLIFSHANIRLHLGALQSWIINPQVHRIHHSRLPQHRDCNFAQLFPVIDRLFGTFYAPQRDEFPPTGTHELASDASIPTTLIRPIRIWASLLKKVVRTVPVLFF
ncbi:MAG: sterol desaturase family protein [Pontiella sp.]